jgi:protein TonB
VELSEVGTAPVLLSTPRPEEVFGADYPPEARAQNIQGIASVRITIDEQGKVIEARAVRGPAPLRGPAEQLALRFRYKPATLNGSPVAVRTSVEIPFRLTD